MAISAQPTGTALSGVRSLKNAAFVRTDWRVVLSIHFPTIYHSWKVPCLRADKHRKDLIVLRFWPLNEQFADGELLGHCIKQLINVCTCMIPISTKKRRALPGQVIVGRALSSVNSEVSNDHQNAQLPNYPTTQLPNYPTTQLIVIQSSAPSARAIGQKVLGFPITGHLMLTVIKAVTFIVNDDVLNRLVCSDKGIHHSI